MVKFRTSYIEIEPHHQPDGCQHQSTTDCLHDQLSVHEVNKTYNTITCYRYKSQTGSCKYQITLNTCRMSPKKVLLPRFTPSEFRDTCTKLMKISYLHVLAPESFDFSSDRIHDPHSVFLDGTNSVSISENIRRIKCAVN